MFSTCVLNSAWQDYIYLYVIADIYGEENTDLRFSQVTADVLSCSLCHFLVQYHVLQETEDSL